MKNMILTFFLFFIVFLDNSYAQNPGDGTLPVLRSIKLRFIDGDLVKLPVSINLAVHEVLIINRPIIKYVEISSVGFKQTLNIIKKTSGIIELKSDDFLHNKSINSEMFALNEFEFVNEIDVNQNRIIQEIRLDIK